MLKKLYAIRDEVSSEVLYPSFFNNDAEAYRHFSDWLINPKSSDSVFCKHPDNFVLFLIGEFNTERLTFESICEPTVRFSDLINAAKPAYTDADDEAPF